jgi:hypothetical protein
MSRGRGHLATSKDKLTDQTFSGWPIPRLGKLQRFPRQFVAMSYKR